MITTNYVTCCQEIIMCSMKETTTSRVYAARFLMPDRRIDNGVKPLSYEMLFLDQTEQLLLRGIYAEDTHNMKALLFHQTTQITYVMSLNFTSKTALIFPFLPFSNQPFQQMSVFKNSTTYFIGDSLVTSQIAQSETNPLLFITLPGGAARWFSVIYGSQNQQSCV